MATRITYGTWRLRPVAVLKKPAQAVGFGAQGERPGLADIRSFAMTRTSSHSTRTPSFLGNVGRPEARVGELQARVRPTLSRLIRRCLLGEIL